MKIGEGQTYNNCEKGLGQFFLHTLYNKFIKSGRGAWSPPGLTALSNGSLPVTDFMGVPPPGGGLQDLLEKVERSRRNTTVESTNIALYISNAHQCAKHIAQPRQPGGFIVLPEPGGIYL